jgi:6,7-dimethyl-8-ribityllumazine synthase
MQHISGSLQAPEQAKIAVVVSQFNSFITDALQKGCVETLQALGVESDHITVVSVPGAFELPMVCSRLAQSNTVHAVIALGCVIRGATTHYDYVCNEAAKGIAQAGIQSGVPVIFGVLTTETIEQAIERSGTKAGNKGADAAMAAVQMVTLLEKLPLSGAIGQERMTFV